jgi:polyisoprenyl-teichoic acid--peptidoglycan teichoic acid transferase
LTPLTPKSGPPGRSSTVAVALSFLWPGLGQWYLGRPRLAAVFAFPIVVAAVGLALLAAGGIEGLAASLLDPTFDIALIVLIVLAGLWRLASMTEVLGSSGRIGSPGRGKLRATFASLAIIVVAVHGLAGYYTWSFYDASSQIFDTSPPPTLPVVANSSPTPYATVLAGSTPQATPSATPTPDKRLTVLLTGIDSGEGRDHALNDSMIVVSLDEVTNQVAMVSFPRDLSNLPLYSGSTYAPKLNSLMTAAYLDPSRYPDGPAGTLTNELGYLLGVPVDYYASIDLTGFVALIDAVGGVDIVNPKPISDPTFGDLGFHGFYLTAGPHHLDGRYALAYVRSRKGPGDSDFTRAARQQDVLVALKKKLTDPAMLPRLPSILQVASRTIRTNFPSNQVSSLLQLAKQVSNPAVTKVVLGPPYSYSPPLSQTNGVYELDLYLSKIEALSVKLFGQGSRYWSATATPSPGAQLWPASGLAPAVAW